MAIQARISLVDKNQHGSSLHVQSDSAARRAELIANRPKATWEYGYLALGNPAAQLWDPLNAGIYGFPLLHTDPVRRGSFGATVATQGRNVKFNYLFCDNHVDFLSPRDTIHNRKCISSPERCRGGDFMWTIRPYDYQY